MVNLLKRKFDILFNPKIVFIFLFILILISYRELFQFYFEADEWFHFAYYLPLTRHSDGLWTAFISTITNTGPLSGGQHVVPIASLIYFLNAKLFGLNYVPYAFISLLLHAINSFLIFLLIKVLLYQKEKITKNIYAFLGVIFFALAPTPMHTVTGAAPFYGQNILSVTFFLLCLLFFKLAFLKEKKEFVYFSVFFLFFSLFTKETSVFLFGLLPILAITEKRVFSLKLLGKIFLISVSLYAVFRFLIPNINTIPDRIVDVYLTSSKNTVSQQKPEDTGTIVSRDLSFHKSLPAEILNRTLTFPVRMIGTLFLPRQTTFSIVEFFTPVIIPLPDSAARLSFLYGAGNFVVIYLAGISVIIFCLSSIFGHIKRKKLPEARTLTTGLAIVIFGALPLVAIIFSFPRWGYDFYFDSRFYYNPNIGAAIVFPFLIFAIARFMSRLLRTQKVQVIILILFTFWLINNIYVFNRTREQFINRYGADRKMLISQLKNHLPSLKNKTVFYFETDGQSAYGPSLPFQTSIPQALILAYYDKSPLPDTFFEKPLFDGKPQGYYYSQGRGFGYYTSKKNLSEALSSKKFSINDVYGFYYYAKQAKLKNITPEFRREFAGAKK